VCRHGLYYVACDSVPGCMVPHTVVARKSAYPSHLPGVQGKAPPDGVSSGAGLVGRGSLAGGADLGCVNNDLEVSGS